MHRHGPRSPDSSNIGLKHVAAGFKIEAAVAGDGRDISSAQTGLTANYFYAELLHIILEPGHAASPGAQKLDGMRRCWGGHIHGHCSTFTLVTGHS